MKLVTIKEFFDHLNIPAQCRKYGLSLWQCPHFLFLVMGIVIIGAILATYTIGLRYIEDPEQVAFIALLLAIFLMVIDFIIIRSFERLAEASRLKTEFISVVTHQLRSPISNLSWTIDLLMSGRLGKIERNQLEYFGILHTNIIRMQELVKDLLTVSRIEMGKLPLTKKEFSLKDLTEELISQFEPFSKASNVQVKLEVQPGLPLVFADPSQIRLILENFLDNAIRYIEEKGEVEIKIEKRDMNLYFQIKDTGVGIPKEDQKYIFQKFFRSSNVLRFQTTGSGLGLYIAKSIVERSGGKIGFKSKEGKGSTFWFTLPIK